MFYMDAAPRPLSVDEVLTLVSQAGASGQWGLLALAVVVAALTVVVTVSGIRGWVASLLPPRPAAWLRTSRAGVVLSLLAGQGAAWLSAALSGQPVPMLAVLGLLSSLVASGGYSWARKGRRRSKPLPPPAPPAT